MIGIYLFLYSEVLGLSTRPRATNGGVNTLTKASLSELLLWPISEEERRAAKRDEFHYI